MIRKKGLFLLFFIFFIQVVKGQDVEITTFTPTTVQVCEGQSPFTIRIENKGTEAVGSFQIDPGLPAGLSYVMGSVTGDLGFVSTSTSNSPLFALGDGEVLAGESTVEFSFQATADCNLLSYIEDNFDNPSEGFVNNNASATYTMAETDYQVEEFEGSDSYNVSAPDLEIGVPEEYINLTTHFKLTPINRIIEINNEGFGGTRRVDFGINYTGDVTVLGLYIINANNEKVQAVERNEELSTPELAVYSLDVEELSYFDSNGDGMYSRGERIRLMDEVQLVNCNGSIRTDYQARWGCGPNYCNEGDQEANFSTYITVPQGSPGFVKKNEVVKDADICNPNDEMIFEFGIFNEGIGNEIKALDITKDIRFTTTINESISTIAEFNLITESGTIVDLSPYINDGSFTKILNKAPAQYTYQINFRDFFTSDPDGPGGFDDLDSDGFYDDVAVGSGVYLQIILSDNSMPSDYQNCNKGRILSNKISSRMYYFNHCNQSKYTDFNLRYSNGNNQGESASGTGYYADNQTGNIEFYYRTNFNGYIAGFNTSNGGYQADFTLPEGFLVERIYWMPNTNRSYIQDIAPEDYVINGNKVTVLPSNDYRSHITYGIDLRYNCSDGTEYFSDAEDILFDYYYVIDANCPEERMQIACNSYTVSYTCGTCSPLETSDFSLTRKTLGYVNRNINYEDILIGTAQQIDPEDPKYNLKAGLPGDEVAISINADINASMTADYFKVQFEHADIFDGLPALENFNNSQLKIAGEIIDISDLEPEINTVDGRISYEFLIPTSYFSDQGNNFETETIIAFNTNSSLAFLDNTAGNYSLEGLQGRLIAGEDSGIEFSCNYKPENFSYIKPYFRDHGVGSYYVCSTDNFRITRLAGARFTESSLVFPGEHRPTEFIQSIDVQIPFGFKRDESVPFTFQGRIVPESNITKIDKHHLVVNFTDDYPVSFFNRESYLTGKIIEDCGDINEIELNLGRYKTFNIESKVTYLSKLYLNDQSKFEDNLFTNHSSIYYMKNANLELTANKTQEAYSRQVSWPVQLCDNSYHSRYYMSNVYSSVELREGDNSTILTGATDNEGNALEVEFYGPVYDGSFGELAGRGKYMMVKLSDIDNNECQYYTVEAGYRNCEDDVTRKLDLYGSWSCDGYPEVSGHTGSIKDLPQDCEIPIQEEELEIRYKTANLQWQVEKLGPTETELCEGVPFRATLLSSKYADMFDLKFSINLPKGMRLDESQPASFTHALNGESPVAIPAAAISTVTLPDGNTGIEWDLSKMLPTSGNGFSGFLPGYRDFPNNSVTLDFQVVDGCDADPGEAIKFAVEGYTNCQDYIQLKDQRKIKLREMPLDELFMSLSADAFTVCNGSTQLDLTVENRGSGPTSPNRLEVKLPPGLSYNGHSGGFGSVQKRSEEGQEVLRWDLSAGFLSASETKTLTMDVSLGDLLVSGTSLYFEARTTMNGQATCVTNDEVCPIVATTGQGDYTMNIDLSYPQASISTTTTFPVCPGSSISLEAEVENQKPGVYRYEWLRGGEMFASTSQPTLTTSLNGSKLGEYSVRVIDPSSCGALSGNSLTFTGEDLFDLPSFTAKAIPTSCQGAEDGSIGFTVTSTAIGQAPFGYELRKGNELYRTGTEVQDGEAQAISDLPQGRYYLSILDANGCTAPRKRIDVLNGGPVTAISCLSDIPCGLTTGDPYELNFNFRVNRRRLTLEGAMELTNYGIRIEDDLGQEIYSSATDAYAYNDAHVFSGQASYTGNDQLYIYIEENGIDCGTDPAPLQLKEARPQISLNEAGGIYQKCYDEQKIDIGAGISGITNCTSTAQLASYSLYSVDKRTGEETLVSAQSGEQALFEDVAVGHYIMRSSISEGPYVLCAIEERNIEVRSSTLEVSLESDAETCLGDEDGRAVAKVSGGQAPYRYYWYDSSDELISRESSADGLSPGDYYLKVKDNRQCVDYEETIDFTIAGGEELSVPAIEAPDEASLDCEIAASLENTTAGETYTFEWVQLQVIKKMEFSNGSIQIVEETKENLVGTQKAVSEGGLVSVTNTLSEVKSGHEYIVRVRNSAGCENESAPTLVEQPSVPRSYELSFSWQTYASETEEEEQEEISDNLQASVAASNLQQEIRQAGTECVARMTGMQRSAVESFCLSKDHVHDEVSMRYTDGAYHYTLYYYDRSGNLVKTVPPKGVNLLDGSAAESADQLPAHELVTSYSYNSLGQLVHQESPDGGETDFIYNNEGQLRFSQNARQAADGTFSYSKYDRLGRIIEVGRATLQGDYNSWAALKADQSSLAADPAFPGAGYGLEEQTQTYYGGDPQLSYRGEVQENLINRVSYVAHHQAGQVSSTYYSYDAHGNVKWMVQDIPGMGRKTMAYEYDLVSGNVKEVAYNAGRPDAFYHAYEYDADNRITAVKTSKDGVLWDTDGRYEYYDHGPLKRSVLGEDKVQGLDYVYTLQGWLKSVNNPGLSTAADPGHDGNNQVGRDVFGMTLNYFSGDYQNDNYAANATSLAIADGKDLYNGNIAAWSLNTARPDGDMLDYEHRIGYNYSYDKLNRLKGSQMSKWESDSWTATQDYATSYSYDANGNIMSLERDGFAAEGQSSAMDRLTYHYGAGNNQLQYVSDAIADEDWDMDVDNQGSGNYSYDEIGNLIADESEGITSIEWTTYGKVSRILKEDGSEVSFLYDGSGNRIRKDVTGPSGAPESTYYVRDASGNVMATYREREEAIEGGHDEVLRLDEQFIYGSDRIGLRKGNGLAMRRIRNLDGLAPYQLGVDELYTAGGNHYHVGVSTGSRGVSLAQLGEGNEGLGAVNALGGATGFGLMGTVTNSSGDLQFSLAVADEMNSSEHVALLTDADGNLMPSGGSLDILSEGQAVGFRRPGTDEEYLLIAPNTTGGWYYHIIDMAAAGNGTETEPKGDVASANNVLLEGDYLAALAIVSDSRQPAEEQFYGYTLELQGGNANQARVKGFKLGADLSLVTTYEGPWKSINSGLESYLQLSPDGNLLAVMSHQGTTDQVNQLAEGGLAWDLYQLESENPEDRPMNFVKRIENVLPQRGLSLQFGDHNDALYYTQASLTDGHRLHRLQLSTGQQYSYAESLGDEARLLGNSSGQLWVAEKGNDGLYAVEGDVLTEDAYLLPEGTLTGEVPAGRLHRLEKPHEDPIYFERMLGLKQYELKDHLGNVRAVVSDRLKKADGSYAAEVASVSDYYAFGMSMPGRGFNGADYRYGFNGKEKDQKGEFGSMTTYDYGFRIYNPGIAKFLSVDPLTKSYPMLTPYQFASNRPIDGIDLDGLEYFRPFILRPLTLSRIATVQAKEKKFIEDGISPMDARIRAELETSLEEIAVLASPILTLFVAEEIIEELAGVPLFPGIEDLAQKAIVRTFNGNVKLRKVFEGADDFNMVYANDVNIGTASLTEGGSVLELDITVPESMRGQGVLKSVVEESVNKWDPSLIKGTWKSDYNGSPSTNYEVYKKYRNEDKMSMEEAALNTPTGRAAQEAGFGGKPIVEETKNTINVTFTPSSN
ncbi:hypothetical protein MATR_21250 [Marivirga tractuosa]|uniref:Conserved repeat domain protein n=1 Tax=Marivirga tractuosa (strain ATCC 23168 / DSM 4126 / NBRC 15989 / NCIMB 1408 / VKM B-1430 / H-43) TaxID=643867 RepID=E4TLW8_MARTH|nr:RHS repeat-associated core domain-containing protein [Marivirga tractuosa]ADR20259.1 conserved repeat domain protein [Marivirga tractuosa DSM 4126]BDD15300.1 hypothetical protein MATR_21250 [Marivirga tractuosa]